MKAVINFENVPGADRDDIAEFIYDALETWGGQLRPCDPLFNSLRLITLTVGQKRFRIVRATAHKGDGRLLDNDPDETSRRRT